MVILCCIRQTYTPESVERKSGSSVEMLEGAREMRGRWNKLSASAWHGARPVVVVSTECSDTEISGSERLFGGVEFQRLPLPCWDVVGSSLHQDFNRAFFGILVQQVHKAIHTNKPSTYDTPLPLQSRTPKLHANRVAPVLPLRVTTAYSKMRSTQTCEGYQSKIALPSHSRDTMGTRG